MNARIANRWCRDHTRRRPVAIIQPARGSHGRGPRIKSGSLEGYFKVFMKSCCAVHLYTFNRAISVLNNPEKEHQINLALLHNLYLSTVGSASAHAIGSTVH
jgi:hypothetical protein